MKDIHEQISIDRRETIESFRNIRLFRNYSKGEHQTTLTRDQQKMLEGVLGNDYCDNVVGQIVSEHADRLELKRITCKDEEVQSWLDTFWQKTKIDDIQQRTHRALIRDGNFCLMPEYNYNTNKIVIHREQWWDGYLGCFIGYDAYGDMLYAVKEWETPQGRMRNIYYDGMIERYIAHGGSNAWLPFVLTTDIGLTGLGGLAPGVQGGKSESVGIPYIDEDGDPLPIPFIHFTNPGDAFDNYGTSILDGGPVGGQDQINDVEYDICCAARMTGYQRTWSRGFKLKKINGVTVRPKTGPGIHYHAEEPTAEWGVLQAGSLSELIGTLESKIKSLCRMTKTPYAAITGNWPAAEALYKLEQPIRGATKSRQKRNTPQWVEVFHRVIEISNAVEHTGMDEEAMLTAVYTDAGDRDPMTIAMADLGFWQAAQAAVMAGLPLETFLRVAGWGDDELTGMSTDIANQIIARRADLDAMQMAGKSSPGNGGAGGTRAKGSGGANSAPNNGSKNKSASQTASKQG